MKMTMTVLPLFLFLQVKNQSSRRFTVQQKSRSSTPRGHTPGSAVVSRRSTPKPTLDTDANSTQYPDPPLPDLSSTSNSTPNASLTNDVANLFNALSAAFAAHPELSEGVRNIVQHATNGAYWNAHRRAVSQAADEVRRAALDGSREIQRATEEVHRATEEAAGRRVTEAIGNVVRVITDLTASTGAAVPEEPVTSTPVREQAASGETPRRRTGSPSRRQTWGGWFGPHPPPHFGPHRHGPFPPRPPFDLYGAPLPPHIRPPHFGPGHHGHGHRGPVPPPPPPPAGPIPSPPPFPPPPGPPPFGPPGMGHHRPPPPPPPPHGGPGHSRHGSLRRRPHQDWFGSSWGADQSGGRPVDIMDITGDVGDMSLFGGAANLTRSASVEQEHAMTRARLEAAKEAYKREKDRYKKERDDLRKEREKRSISMEEKIPNPEPAPELRATSSVPVAGPSGSRSRSRSRPRTPPSVSQIVSNARGPYPQLEMFSVPRRSNTIQGTGRERSIHRQNPLAGPSQIYSPFTPTPAARTSENVKRRLADMGFTRDVYPNIPDKVAKRVSQSVVSQSFMSQKDVEEISKDKEDTIVSDVLEELLQEPPPPLPAKDRPTGSGAKPDEDDLLF
ncbi:hypothetical protein QCA50_002181 [Cerrena zonata]|uniref:Uncharacterized protein n=1 Tax=Cerrena zonata TaxID=2478898 RepID=A0AAW0GMY4_9APHY